MMLHHFYTLFSSPADGWDVDEDIVPGLEGESPLHEQVRHLGLEGGGSHHRAAPVARTQPGDHCTLAEEEQDHYHHPHHHDTL